LTAAELTLEDLDALYESPVMDELADERETRSFMFSAGH
jgi:hypothetical protein